MDWLIESGIALRNLVREFWPQITAVLHLGTATVASGHAILFKRESRSTVGWVGLIWLSPFLGSLIYYVLGINRVERRAVKLKKSYSESLIDRKQQTQTLPPDNEPRLRTLALFGNTATKTPLVSGNRVTPLENGDAAYPHMIEAIENAESTVGLATYIFDNDVAGKQFVEALRRALARGVRVRVLVDATGIRYSFPSIVGQFKRHRIPYARFHPTIFPWQAGHLNLRNHRKLLIVDGSVGFTGGMNIREGNLLKCKTAHPVRDLHFEILGPLVRQLQEVFLTDWYFASREKLNSELWLKTPEPQGSVLARGIPDGPGKDFEKVRWTILGALASAEKRIRIITPYFLPDNTLVTFLNLLAMGGIRIEILIPEKCNIKLVQWASQASLAPMLQAGCQVYRSPPPFDHSKLMIIDDKWVLLGSANWDDRSLRLNFEFNVECYDAPLAKRMNQFFEARMAKSTRLSLSDLNARRLPIKLRDGVAKLFSPYL